MHATLKTGSLILIISPPLGLMLFLIGNFCSINNIGFSEILSTLSLASYNLIKNASGYISASILTATIAIGAAYTTMLSHQSKELPPFIFEVIHKNASPLRVFIVNFFSAFSILILSHSGIATNSNSLFIGIIIGLILIYCLGSAYKSYKEIINCLLLEMPSIHLRRYLASPPMNKDKVVFRLKDSLIRTRDKNDKYKSFLIHQVLIDYWLENLTNKITSEFDGSVYKFVDYDVDNTNVLLDMGLELLDIAKMTGSSQSEEDNLRTFITELHEYVNGINKNSIHAECLIWILHSIDYESHTPSFEHVPAEDVVFKFLDILNMLGYEKFLSDIKNYDLPYISPNNLCYGLGEIISLNPGAAWRAANRIHKINYMESIGHAIIDANGEDFYLSTLSDEGISSYTRSLLTIKENDFPSVRQEGGSEISNIFICTLLRLLEKNINNLKDREDEGYKRLNDVVSDTLSGTLLIRNIAKSSNIKAPLRNENYIFNIAIHIHNQRFYKESAILLSTLFFLYAEEFGEKNCEGLIRAALGLAHSLVHIEKAHPESVDGNNKSLSQLILHILLRAQIGFPEIHKFFIDNLDITPPDVRTLKEYEFITFKIYLSDTNFLRFTINHKKEFSCRAGVIYEKGFESDEDNYFFDRVES